MPSIIRSLTIKKNVKEKEKKKFPIKKKFGEYILELADINTSSFAPTLYNLHAVEVSYEQPNWSREILSNTPNARINTGSY